MPYVLLRNGWYHENYTENLGPVLEHDAVVAAAGEGRISSASRADYAAAAVAVLTGEGHENATYELGGDEAWSFAEYAAELSRQTGREIVYNPVTPEQLTGILVGAGLPEPMAAMFAGVDAAIAEGQLVVDSGDLSRLAGRPTTPARRGRRRRAQGLTRVPWRRRPAPGAPRAPVAATPTVMTVCRYGHDTWGVRRYRRPGGSARASAVPGRLQDAWDMKEGPVTGKPAAERRTGLLNGFAAYGMWGLVPLFWPLLKPAGAVEILAHRMVWSLVFVAAALAVVRRWAWIGELVRQPRRLALITVAAAVITVNWASTSGR